MHHDTMTESWKDIQGARVNEMTAYAFFLVLVTADIAITLYALNIGFLEGNPMMAFLIDISVPLAISVRFAFHMIPAVIILVLFRGRGKNVILASAIVPACITLFAVAWNVVQLVLVMLP